jgi:hypothetical protein
MSSCSPARAMFGLWPRIAHLWRTRLLRLWLVLLPLYTLQVFVHYGALGADVALADASRIALQDALIWLALSPLVAALYLQRRLLAAPLHNLALHLLAALAVALLHVLLDALLGAAVAGALGGRADPAGLFGFLLPLTLGPNLMLYGLQFGWLVVAERRTPAPPPQPTSAAATSTAVPALCFNDGARRWRIPHADIRRIEAAGNYAAIVHAGGTAIMRTTLSELEHRLAASGFIRVHRSTLINPAHARALTGGAHGDARLKFDDGGEVRVSRRYRAALERAL